MMLHKPLQAFPHACLDYIVGLATLASPWIFGFNDISSTATQVMVAVGLVVLGLSLLTDYPLGLIKAVPFKVHGTLETLGGIMLLISPWIFGYVNQSQIATVYAVITGIIWLGVVAITNY